jgi:hypothetical protein
MTDDQTVGYRRTSIPNALTDDSPDIGLFDD